MNLQGKIVMRLGELFRTAKGGGIQEFVVTTSEGLSETCKLHASSKDIPALAALKAGDMVKCQVPENFFFLQV